MMNKFIGVFLVFIGMLACSLVNKEKEENTKSLTESSYEELLLTFLASLDIDSAIKTEQLEKIIPASLKEFDIYYNCFLDSNLKDKIIFVNDKIGYYATNGYDIIFDKYILTYRFLNINKHGEEFVEDTFYDIEFAIGKNVTRFCKIYHEYSSENKSSMKEFYEIYCKD